MRIEVINGHRAVCGHIFPKDELKIGTKWISADGSNRIVEIRDLVRYGIGTQFEDISVYYGEHATDQTYEKDSFAFQCRYCLIVES